MKKLIPKKIAIPIVIVPRLSFSYQQYPSCCVAGLASDFALKGGPVDEKVKKNAMDELEDRMCGSGHSITTLMDTEYGFGFQCFRDNPKIQFLSATFNKNSGNFVYLMQYTL